LLLVELALTRVEHLLQGGLHAEAVFGLHHGALGVDDADAHRLSRRWEREQRQREGKEGGRELGCESGHGRGA
jgi:hypothetical protein